VAFLVLRDTQHANHHRFPFPCVFFLFPHYFFFFSYICRLLLDLAGVLAFNVVILLQPI